MSRTFQRSWPFESKITIREFDNRKIHYIALKLYTIDDRACDRVHVIYTCINVCRVWRTCIMYIIVAELNI